MGKSFSGSKKIVQSLFHFWMRLVQRALNCKSVKIETVDMMNTFLGIKIPINSLNKEEAIDMCKAWDEQRAEGREEGREEGRAEGREEGRAEGRTEGLIEERIHTLLEFNKTPDECINDIIKRYGLSEEDARNYFDKFAVGHADIFLDRYAYTPSII